MKHINTRIPLIGLFVLIAVMAMLLMTYSAKIYDNLVKNNYRHDTAEIASDYIIEKIRQTDLVNAVSLDTNQIIVTDEDVSTIIYLYNGYLYEANIYADKQLKIGTGEALFPLSDMKTDITDGILHVTLEDKDGNTATKRLRLYETHE